MEEQNITIAEQKYKYMWNTNLPMKIPWNKILVPRGTTV
jgi:hypothetical protein